MDEALIVKRLAIEAHEREKTEKEQEAQQTIDTHRQRLGLVK